MNRFQELEQMIKRYKAFEAKYASRMERTPASQYDIYRRYTSSAKDHSPQLRASRNIRKPLPIVGSNNCLMPNKYKEYPIKGDRELGEKNLIRYSAVAPDLWSLIGEEAKKETTDAILMQERERTERYFNLENGEIQFMKISPIRKYMKIKPTLGNVSGSEINDTLLCAIFPNLAAPNNTDNSNQDAVKLLMDVIGPMSEFKTMEGLIHLARSQIRPEF
jgi:hypothetical protein